MTDKVTLSPAVEIGACDENLVRFFQAGIQVAFNCFHLSQGQIAPEHGFLYGFQSVFAQFLENMRAYLVIFNVVADQIFLSQWVAHGFIQSPFK